MVLCAECKVKTVFIDNSGRPAEFCSNLCRKTAVEKRHVQPCIKCQSWPMVRLPDGSRSPYCGKNCQNLAGASSPVGSPIQLQPQPSYRPINYPIMAPPQLNQPNPLLSNGGARPIGSPWVMTTVPFCRYCQVNPCWKDTVKQLYSSYCSRRCKEAAERAPRAVSNMNNAPPFTSQQNYNGQMISQVITDPKISPVSLTNGKLPSPQYSSYQQSQQQSYFPNPVQQHQKQFQSPPYPSNNIQRPQQLQNTSNNIQRPQQPQNPSNNTRPYENPSQPRMNNNSRHSISHINDNPQQNDESQTSDGPLNSGSSGHRHFRYPTTDTPISHPNSHSQAPPPIPTNKPIQIPQNVNPMPINITINTSQPIQSPPSQQPTETHPRSPLSRSNSDSHSQPEVQVQGQDRPRSIAQVQQRPQSQGQVQEQIAQSQDLPQQQNQLENNFMMTPYVYNPEDDTDEPPPYTPNDAYTRNIAPGEDISIRKITRDDSFDDENPYGFRDDNSNEQDQDNNQPINQSINNQGQRSRNILRRR
ncbi:hypothetical protein C1645_801485 [Glomus cerebriforme]|uniref:Uncharacterized protein n=1 Tax=Glomus cerebriforme TaxID=658196 RepID=A0A397TLT7_9GLOM|nr:hypothetical protein C1645_801485 [Glomus cerebriforme]